MRAEHNFIQFIHVNYNCLNFYSCLLNQAAAAKQKRKQKNVTWLRFLSFRNSLSQCFRNQTSQPFRKNKQFKLLCIVCWKNSFRFGIPLRFSVWFSLSLSLSSSQQRECLEYFLFCFNKEFLLFVLVSSTYLKLSESIIFPSLRQAVRRQKLKQYLDS